MASKSPPIQVPFGNPVDVLNFSDYDEVQDWLNTENEAWDWLLHPSEVLSGPERNAQARLTEFLGSMAAEIRHAKANSLTIDFVVRMFASHGQNTIYSNSIKGQRIREINQSLGLKAGATAYAFAAGYLNLAQIGSEEHFKGVIEYCFPKGADLVKIRDRLAAERQNFARSLRTLTQSINEQESARQERDEEWIDTRQGLLVELADGLWTSWEARAEAWKSRLDEAESSIRAVEKQYTEFMELKAPVEYWNEQAGRHRNSSRMFAFLLVVYFGLAIGSLIEAYFSVGESLFKWISDIDNAGKSILLYYATGGLLVLTTLVFWIGRILSRMYLSERHLATDATQRATMTKTYLALIPQSNDDKNSREIILNALFRATSDGVVKDEGGDTNLAMLLSRMNLPK